MCGWEPWGGLASAPRAEWRASGLSQTEPRGPLTHRWARQAGESSLTTLPRQAHDAPLTSQTLGTWRTVGTLRGKVGAETSRTAAARAPTQAGPVPTPQGAAALHPPSTLLGSVALWRCPHSMLPLPHSMLSELRTGSSPWPWANPGQRRDSQRDRHLQALPSRQGLRPDLGGQGHQLGRGAHCLLEHLWDRLFQKDQGDQGVQGCPRRSKCRK